MRKLLALLLLLPLLSCARKPASPTLVMILDNSPANLDPRIGTDAASERLHELIFDSLVVRDEHFNLRPWLAASWDIPDPKTYVFHLRTDVRFHNGQPLTARDVKWTFDSLLHGGVVSPRAGAYQQVDSVDAPDDKTVVFHLKAPYAPLLWNLSNGAMGIVPYGSGKDFSQHPIGSGPFKFVSAELDKDVVIERNDEYWGEKPKITRVRFAVIPDATTRALELEKGSADVAINSLTPDMEAHIRDTDKRLVVERTPGTTLQYLAFNLRDPILSDVRVRQALAYAIDRKPLIDYLWQGLARPADSILPPEAWAYDGAVAHYEHDPAKARAMLDAAGYRPVNGVRFHLTMKTSTDEAPRLVAAVLQQQMREVGIVLDIRTFEFATFYTDVQKGAFQMYSLRWIGAEDPDIFENVFYSTNVPPKRANRGHYANSRVDALIDAGRQELDQEKRKQIYAELQRILADELPYIDMWYLDNVVVHTPRVTNIHVSPSGSYEFLRDAELH
jgi:peptide/nickel transport system substrate-binding protein